MCSLLSVRDSICLEDIRDGAHCWKLTEDALIYMYYLRISTNKSQAIPFVYRGNMKCFVSYLKFVGEFLFYFHNIGYLKNIGTCVWFLKELWQFYSHVCTLNESDTNIEALTDKPMGGWIFINEISNKNEIRSGNIWACMTLDYQWNTGFSIDVL